MSFTLLVCSDVCGQKINLELPFERPPTIDELRRKVDHAFYMELKAMDREGALSEQGLQLLLESVPPAVQRDGSYLDCGLLALHRIQFYDDETLRWVDLTARHELHEYDQLYIFPRHRRHLSNDKDLPPPRAAISRGRSPPRAAAVATATTTPVRPAASLNHSAPAAAATAPRTGTRPSDEGRVKSVFAQMDRDSKGRVNLHDWRAAFQRLSIGFAPNVTDDIFRHYCSSEGEATSRVLLLRDFAAFAESYPTLFAVMHARLAAMQAEDGLSSDVQLLRERNAQRRRREEDINRELRELRAQSEEDEKRLRTTEAKLADMRQRSTETAEEEQVLLDKELRVVFQRVQLMREEAELAEATRRFDARATGHQHRSGAATSSW